MILQFQPGTKTQLPLCFSIQRGSRQLKHLILKLEILTQKDTGNTTQRHKFKKIISELGTLNAGQKMQSTQIKDQTLPLLKQWF